MSSKEHNKHVPYQLLVVQPELGTMVFVCRNQLGEHVVPFFRYAGRTRRDIGFALSDLGAHECHELLVGFFRFLQSV
jgi:hypothetical protein